MTLKEMYALKKKAKTMDVKNIEENLKRIEELSEKVKPGSPEYEKLRKAYEQELRNKKLVLELRKPHVDWVKVTLILGSVVMTVGGFLVQLETPLGEKLANFGLGLLTKIRKI